MGISIWKSLVFFAAIMLFSIKLFPSERQIGFYYSESHLLNKARVYLEQQFHKDPEDIANTKRYLESLANHGEYDLLEKIGERFLLKDPQNEVIHRVMAKLYSHQLRYQEASRHWEVLYWQNPKDEESRDQLTSHFYVTKNYEGLIRVYANELKLGHAPIETYSELAQIYSLTRRPKEAEAVYLKLLKRFPEEEEVKMKLGGLYDFTGDPNKALIHYRGLADEYPDNREYALKLADRLVHYRQEGADFILRTFSDRFSDNRAFLTLLSDFYINQNRKQEAVAILEKLYAQDPEDLKTIKALGETYFDLKLFEKAKGMLARYHEKMDGDYHTHHILGDVHAALGESDASRREYERALESIRQEN